MDIPTPGEVAERIARKPAIVPSELYLQKFSDAANRLAGPPLRVRVNIGGMGEPPQTRESILAARDAITAAGWPLVEADELSGTRDASHDEIWEEIAASSPVAMVGGS
jgi:hypothetical protein